MARYSPIIADRQAAAVALLPPFKAAALALREGNAQRLSLDQALSRLRAIEDRERTAIAWSAQYDDGIAVGTEVSIAKTTRGRYIITSIGATDDCEHDSDALPTYNLFVNAALQTGVETWRPKWRSGRVLAINNDGTLKVEVTDSELFGSLGTRVSRNEIVCVPPQAYFDEDGPLDTTQAAREAYDAAREDWVEAAEALDTCIAAFDLNGCLADASGCQDTLNQDKLGCLDARAAGIAACAGDPGCIAYVEEQYQECVESAESNFTACVEGVQTQCALDQRNHEDQCRTNLQPAIDQAVSALAEAEQDLTLAIQRTAQPASPCILESVPVEHCSALAYEVDDDVLIEFTERAASAPVAPDASAEAIRAAAMAAWRSARDVGWASETRRCGGACVYSVALSQSGYGASCYVSPVGASGGIPTWREMIALYDEAIAGTLTVSAGYADAEPLGQPLTWVDLAHQYVDSGGEAFYVRAGCDPSVIDTSPFLYLSNAREYFETPYYDEQVYACNADRAAARSAADATYAAAIAQILADEIACKNAVTQYSIEWWACRTAADALRSDALDAKNAAYDAADDAHDACVAAAQRPLPSLDDKPLEFVSALTEGTAYYGIQCSGTGYHDCEQTQRTVGKPIQAYRIVGTAARMDFRIDYVGLGADLEPACDQVVVVSTTALVHPTVQIECPDTDVIGTALDIEL
jgi:hypothetical protein